MAVADFNGDGKLDIDNYVTEFLGNGDGTFQAGIVYPNGASLAQIAAPQAVGDFNQDGHPDVVTGGDAATIALNAASATRFSTTTTTVATPDICVVGITATVANSAGPLPTGGVTQQVDGQYAGYLGPPNSAGMVTGGTGLLLPGNHTIAIAYSGIFLRRAVLAPQWSPQACRIRRQSLVPTGIRQLRVIWPTSAFVSRRIAVWDREQLGEQ